MYKISIITIKSRIHSLLEIKRLILLNHELSFENEDAVNLINDEIEFYLKTYDLNIDSEGNVI